MQVEIELNRIKVKKNLPTSWREVTFDQFLKLDACGQDYVKIFSLFLGVDEETMRKAKVIGLDVVLLALNFLNTPPELTIHETILGYKIPKDLGFETVGQYMDLRKDIDDSRELTPMQQLEKYPLYCAMYAKQPYDWREAEKMAPEFLNAPASEVLAIGHFTLMKLVGLSSSTNPTSPKISSRLKRFKRALIYWVKSMGVMVRFYIWKKKQGIKGTT